MKIIKSLLVVSTVILSILLLAACEKTWQIDLGNSAECGGNIGKIEYNDMLPIGSVVLLMVEHKV